MKPNVRTWVTVMSGCRINIHLHCSCRVFVLWYVTKLYARAVCGIRKLRDSMQPARKSVSDLKLLDVVWILRPKPDTSWPRHE